MICTREKYRWLKLLRNGLLSHIVYKNYVKKLRLLLKTVRKQYLFRRLSSLNTDMKRKYKVLNNLMGNNKKSLQKEFNIDGVSTTDNTKICNSFCNYIIDHPKNIHEPIPARNSQHMDHIHIKDRSMYFRHAIETEIVESIMQLNKEGGINDVSIKFVCMCKNHVSYYL